MSSDAAIQLEDSAGSIRIDAESVVMQPREGEPVRFALRDVRHVEFSRHDRVALILCDVAEQSFAEITVKVGMASAQDHVDLLEQHLDEHAPGLLYSVLDTDGLRLSQDVGLAQILHHLEPVSELRQGDSTAMPRRLIIETASGRWSVEVDRVVRATAPDREWLDGLVVDANRALRADGLVVGELVRGWEQLEIGLFNGAVLGLQENRSRFSLDGQMIGSLELRRLHTSTPIPEVLLVMVQLVRTGQFAPQLGVRNSDGSIAAMAGLIAVSCGLLFLGVGSRTGVAGSGSVCLLVAAFLGGATAALSALVFWIRSRATRVVQREFGIQ